MFNFIYALLNNSIRLLHITNRVVPIVKNIYPQISLVQGTVKKLLDNGFTLVNNSSQNNDTLQNEVTTETNTPTFFQ